MAGRGERNARHDDRFPAIDPYFDLSSYAPSLSYLARDSRDYTGYSTQDGQLPARLHELAFDPEVKAALGGEIVGRLAVSSYGNAEGPAPGSYIQGLDAYDLYGFPCEPMDVPAGACSTRGRLGVPPASTDDTSFTGVGGSMFLTQQHAMGHAPLLGATSAGVGGPTPGSAAAYDGVTSEHVLSRIRSYASNGLYDGGDVPGYGMYRSAPAIELGDSIDAEGYPTQTSQLDNDTRGEDGPGYVGGGDYGDVSPSEELANIRRENDSGDEFAGDGWDGPPTSRKDSSGNVYSGYGKGARPPTSYDRRKVRNTDYDR